MTRRRSRGGTTPETKPQPGSEVAQFSVSAGAQLSMSLDTVARHGFMQAPEITSGTTLLIDQTIQPHAAQTEKLPT